MIIQNKKHYLTQILGPDPAEEKEAEAGDSGLRTCVSEFIDAVHNKDVEGAVNAFKACFASLEAGDEEA